MQNLLSPIIVKFDSIVTKVMNIAQYHSDLKEFPDTENKSNVSSHSLEEFEH